MLKYIGRKNTVNVGGRFLQPGDIVGHDEVDPDTYQRLAQRSDFESNEKKPARVAVPAEPDVTEPEEQNDG